MLELAELVQQPFATYGVGWVFNALPPGALDDTRGVALGRTLKSVSDDADQSAFVSGRRPVCLAPFVLEAVFRVPQAVPGFGAGQVRGLQQHGQ